METINFDIVADLYDFYVNTKDDVPFFIKELGNIKGKILELMCGTGRISIPLLENNIALTCVDYSEKMLNIFENKIKKKHYNVSLIKMDVTKLCLNEKYELIFIPFHSFSEILSKRKQVQTLKNIFNHLQNNGKFICTLHNPNIRIKSANGELKILGKYPKDDGTLIIYYLNRHNHLDNIISGYQLYKIYDCNNMLKEERKLGLNFRIIWQYEFEKMIKEIGFNINKIYGDYNYSEYDEKTSNNIIYILQKVV